MIHAFLVQCMCLWLMINCMTQLSSCEPEQTTLILGFGNPLCGDDGAGAKVIELLPKHQLPYNVSVMNAGLPGWSLPSWFEGWQTVILIDAMEMGEMPGTWRKIHLRPISENIQAGDDPIKFKQKSEIFSIHQPDLANGLALAEALDLLPSNLILYVIQPLTIEVGYSLSEAVQKSLPGLIESILDDLGIVIYEPKKNFAS